MRFQTVDPRGILGNIPEDQQFEGSQKNARRPSNRLSGWFLGP